MTDFVFLVIILAKTGQVRHPFQSTFLNSDNLKTGSSFKWRPK